MYSWRADHAAARRGAARRIITGLAPQTITLCTHHTDTNWPASVHSASSYRQSARRTVRRLLIVRQWRHQHSSRLNFGEFKTVYGECRSTSLHWRSGLMGS